MSLSRAEVIAYLEGLGSLELGELIDALQQRLGLAPVVAPPVFVTMGMPLYTTHEADEVHAVVLTAIGPRKVRVLQALREKLPLALSDALRLLDALPATVATRQHPDDARALVELLREAGAQAELRPSTGSG